MVAIFSWKNHDNDEDDDLDDRDNGKADDTEMIEDEIDTTTMVAETTGQSSLKTMIRSFLELFTMEKNNLILNMRNDSNWDKNNDF